MCGQVCVGFIGFILKDKRLVECFNLFAFKEQRKNDKIILNCFQLNPNNLK